MFIKSLENTCVHTKKNLFNFFLIQRIIYIHLYDKYYNSYLCGQNCDGLTAVSVYKWL